MSISIGIIGGAVCATWRSSPIAKSAMSTHRLAIRRPRMIGTLRGKRVAFLARHGLGHRIMPSELNFRANIYGFKTLGVDYILSASAVGSLKEQCKPLDLVIPDQFVDRTRGRVSTFFGRGLVAHVGFAHRSARSSAMCVSRGAGVFRHRAQARHLRLHGRAAVFDIRRVEPVSLLGMDIIGMTNLQEAKLARRRRSATRPSRS